MKELGIIKALLERIFQRPWDEPWRAHGFGVLQLNLPGDYRLHVWDKSLLTPGVSLIHDHLQWHLSSYVISGRLHNRRYVQNARSLPSNTPYMRLLIQTGVEAHSMEPPVQTWLCQVSNEVYFTGEHYSQDPREIHETAAEDGTVTIIKRTRTGVDTANVFFPMLASWGNANVHPATREEIERALSNVRRVD